MAFQARLIADDRWTVVRSGDHRTLHNYHVLKSVPLHITAYTAGGWLSAHSVSLSTSQHKRLYNDRVQN